MRTILLTALMLVRAGFVAAGDAIPQPSTDRIDYDHPENYLQLHESFGDEAKIRELAGKLKAGSPEKTIAAINRWIGRNLKYDGDAAYAWRNFDDVTASRCFGGCADYAVTFAALARACDIPTVFVKTMDVPWIYRFCETGTCDVWSGHVFLEVYIDGKWKLLEPTGCTLYDKYEPTQRILPGNRFAYDKGRDPYELVLSLDWEKWKKQTAAYFHKDFDLSQLPVGEGRELPSPDDVFIAADSPVYQALTDRCRALGYHVRKSFNTDYDECLRMAKGCQLIVMCAGDRIVLPSDRYEEFLPIPYDELRRRLAQGEKGTLSKKLDDGTQVTLIYAGDVDGVLELVRTMEIPADS